MRRLQLVAVRAAGELERRQAEAALRQSERFIKSVAEASPDWLYVFARRSDGTVKRVLGLLLDTTERKQAEEALRAASKPTPREAVTPSLLIRVSSVPSGHYDGSE